MDKHAYDEVLATFAAQRLISSEYRYFKDRYSLALLHAALPADDRPVALAELKQGPFVRLFDKPRVADLVRRNQGRALTRSLVGHADHDREEVAYRLGFSTWGEAAGRASQTSRRGVNLVVQLNFDRSHDEAYERLIKPARGKHPFCYRDHPASRSRNTMAWARVDLDFDTSEALIEEVKTDWLRNAREAANDAAWALTPDPKGQARRFDYWCVGGSAAQSARYYEHHAARHAGLWSEAVLSATLHVLVQHLRIRRVFLHTLESGKTLRECKWWSPPRSLYTDLPRQFCFRQTQTPPMFLEREPHVRALRKKAALSSLHLLEL